MIIFLVLVLSLVKDFLEVVFVVWLFFNWGNKFLLGVSFEKKFYEEDFICIDFGFFDIFIFFILYGDLVKVLEKWD